MTNYLDDFLFIDANQSGCNHLVSEILRICELIKFPVAMEKTFWAARTTVFLGMMLLSDSMCLSVPEDKRLKAIKMLQYLIEKKKATVKELERLAGFLNFLNKAVVPGRSFTRRMYAKFSGKVRLSKNDERQSYVKPYHHLRLDVEFQMIVESG